MNENITDINKLNKGDIVLCEFEPSKIKVLPTVSLFKTEIKNVKSICKIGKLND